MSFKNQKWDQRIETLGDPAETAFQEWADNLFYPYVRYGLNRPPIDMRLTPVKIRYTPDYLTNFGLVEVQGCGRDGLFKFKHEKLDALREWQQDCPVSLWLWNQPKNEGYLLMLDRVLSVCTEGDGYRTDGLFDGHKPYTHFSAATAADLHADLGV